MKSTIWLLAILILLMGVCFGLNLGGQRFSEAGGWLRTSGIQPNYDEKTHTAGELYFTVSNWGFFGSQRGNDDPRYCINDDEGICGEPGGCRPSAEYPGCSGIEYLFQGALWIGAVIAGDTMVSVGEDGWVTNINELLPSYLDDDTLVMRSILRGDPDAVSEQDYVGNFSDTCKNPIVVNPDHTPIGIAIHQESYSWSYNYSKNIVFIDYTFKNIRADKRTINDMYIGLYIDGDCGHVQTPNYAQDDITGFIKHYIDYTTVPPETIPVMVAWIADNDGDPSDGAFTDRSPTGAMAVRVLRGPAGTCLDSLNFSYNWWISNTDETYDWGPCMVDLGWDGTPEGDLKKYQVMSNGEFDYDQTDIERYKDDPNWSGCPITGTWWQNIRDGYDTRFLLSFGPISIEPDSEVHVTIAFFVAEGFHTNPQNTGTAWDPSEFNFDDLAYSAYWAALIFDNNGDGIPDYKGPMPPPAPDFKVITENYKIIVLWTGEGVENTEDPITHLKDFEGYRVYIAEANLDKYFVPLAQFDKVDYLKCERIIQNISPSGETTYSVIYSDSLVSTPTPYTIPIITPSGEPVGRDTTLIPQPFDYNMGMPPETTIDGKTYYYYVIENLLPGDDKYIVVTAYDYGKPSKNLEPLESSKTNYAKWVVPKGTPITDKKVRVVPNPYRVDHDYKVFWEKSYTSEWTEYSRKIRFFNLPKRCEIRILTVDGDLVRVLLHDEIANPSAMVGAEDWNLISLNDQAISSGIYVYSVKDLDTGEIQTGTFVIIK